MAGLTACTRAHALAVPIPSCNFWNASTAYALNTRVMLQQTNGFWYLCTVAGTTGTVQPTWPTVNGATVVDGGVTWTAVAGLPNAYHMHDLVSGRDLYGLLDVYLNYSGLTIYNFFYLPFSDYNRRPEVMYNSPGTPVIWSQMNQVLYVAAAPNMDYTANLDCVVVPLDLLQSTDKDGDIPAPQDTLVPYYMAYLAKLKDQRRQEANEFLGDFYREAQFWIGAQIQRRLVGR